MKSFALRARLAALLLALALAIGCAACAAPGADETDASASSPAETLTEGATEPSADAGTSVSIDIFAVNDLHGKFDDTSTQPGVDELTTYLATGENTLVLSSGDMWQGSSESNLAHGFLITEWMNAVGFVSMTIGNHEFDWGAEYIEENAALAEFPLLAINIYSRDTNEQVDYCSSSVMVERGGVQIGIIGAIGDCYSSISSDKTEDVYFITGSELAALIADEAARLREEGAQIVILSLHDGASGIGSTATDEEIADYYKAYLSESAIDLVFEAHTHQSYVYTDSYGVYHLQGGGENKGISHVSLRYDTESGEITIDTAEVVSASVYSGYDADPIRDTLLEAYAAEIALGTTELGYNATERSSSYLSDLVAQLYLEAGEERWGGEYSIVLAGGYISARSPYSLSTGTIYYSDLQSLFPFDNIITLASISGSDLQRVFVNTTNSNYHICYSEYGESILSAISPNETYYVITDSYSSSYARNNMTVVAEYDAETFARDLLALYAAEGGFGTEPDFSKMSLTSIADILSLGEALGAGEMTTQGYLVQGTVTAISNTTYGNLTIADETGAELYIYGLYDSTGTVRFDSLSEQPQVGDTILVYGCVQRYVSGSSSTVEIYHGWLMETAQ
ncbi:MAG: metallophosphoesterase [Firmicutes bacterium]|nr:metallophosphoesterase [Bacillota bacterium]